MTAYYLVKWKNNNFQKFTFEHSSLMENNSYLKEKIYQYEKYKNHLKNYDSSLIFSQLIDQFSINFSKDLGFYENFIDLFQRSNLFIPFKIESDYLHFREIVIKLISQFYSIKVLY